MPAKQESCATRVRNTAQRQIEAIRLMLCPEESDVELLDDGSLDTVLQLGDSEYRYSAEHASAYRSEDGTLDLDDIVSDHWDEIAEEARERFHEHGLSFEYVQHRDGEPYWCYLISTGGPGTEIRFFANRTRNGLRLYRAEFWLLDWFDGAHVVVTSDETVQALWAYFDDCGTAAYVQDKECER